MDSDNPVPRVNFGTMERHINQRVKLVCKVDQVGNGQVQVTTPDGAHVTVITAPGQAPFTSLYAEVEGMVMDPKTIREEEHTDFGDNFGEQGRPAGIARAHPAARRCLPRRSADELPRRSQT
jgi:hypothetical protein